MPTCVPYSLVTFKSEPNVVYRIAGNESHRVRIGVGTQQIDQWLLGLGGFANAIVPFDDVGDPRFAEWKNSIPLYPQGYVAAVPPTPAQNSAPVLAVLNPAVTTLNSVAAAVIPEVADILAKVIALTPGGGIPIDVPSLVAAIKTAVIAVINDTQLQSVPGILEVVE